MNKILKSKKLWIVVVVLFVLGGIATAIDNTKPVTQQTSNTQQTQSANEAQKLDYNVLSRQENKTVENIAVLITSGDTKAEAIAMEVKKTCKKPCNIDVYDDQKAYDLNTQYDKMMGESTTQPEDLTAWK